MGVTLSRHFFFPDALLAEGWNSDVSLQVDARGIIKSVTVNSSPTEDASIVSGPVIPGMTNVHSHAFQRVMSGITETRFGDNFWGWRETMYQVASRITPEQLKVIATQLYSEMLRAGFTSVGEFHYLHHQPNGQPYDNPAEMSLALLEAAAETGIGMTLLPVLYRYSDFGQAVAEPRQCRFVSSPDQYHELFQGLGEAVKESPLAVIGIAPHSLRAVSIDELDAVTSAIRDVPVHIHVAEQIREVEAAVKFSGKRPVELLFDQLKVDSNWCLIHCTHLIEKEIDAIAESGAVVGICPTTEANLGDGVLPAEELLAKGAVAAIGTDSNVSVDPLGELRLLEYAQRLIQRRRGVLTALPDGLNLWQRCAEGGARALGQPVGVLQTGKRADFLVLDKDHQALVGRSSSQLLDSLIFAADPTAIRDVYVGGSKMVSEGHVNNREQRLRAFAQVIAALS